MVGLSSQRGLRPDLAQAFAERGVYVGIRGSCIRVAPHLHLTADALDRFIEALQAVAA
jgi:4-aminobutyrate aminotransferase-like enzyme